MRLNIFKNSLIALAAINMVSFSPALASTVKEQKRATLEQILKPALKGHSLRTVGDFRKALAPHMSEEARQALDKLYSQHDKAKMPQIQITGDKLFVRIDKKLVTMELLGERDAFIMVEGIKFSADEVKSPEKFAQKLNSNLDNPEKVRHFSLIMDLLFPKAHAIDWMTALVGAVIGGGAVMAYNWWFKDDEKEEDKGLTDEQARYYYLQGKAAGMQQGSGSGTAGIIQ